MRLGRQSLSRPFLYRHEARFAGVFMFFANIMAGIALEVMLLLLEHFGYDGTKKLGEPEPEDVVMTIRVGYGAALAIMLVFITPSMILYPITRKSHAVSTPDFGVATSGTLPRGCDEATLRGVLQS